MPGHKNKFTNCVVNHSRLALRTALWLLVALVWVSTAKSQEPPAQPAFAVADTNSQTPANASAPGSDLSDPPPVASDLPVEAMFPHLGSTRFWLSGQANFIFQTNPPFHAAYSGKHSLGPNYEKALSRVMTLYTGVRLNNSTEVLVDIEDAAGGGLSNALGLGGITNLDVVRIPGEGSSLSTAPYLARGIIHKVFALSKDKIENDRNALSLFDELPRRRLEVRFGKFGLADFFDQNSAGSDSHFQFTNWTVDQTGAWDFAADTCGYTVGVTADFEERNWGFRFAEALMPKVASAESSSLWSHRKRLGSTFLPFLSRRVRRPEISAAFRRSDRVHDQSRRIEHGRRVAAAVHGGNDRAPEGGKKLEHSPIRFARGRRGRARAPERPDSPEGWAVL
jgi:hypothetical protein